MPDHQVIHQGKFLSYIQSGSWEYVKREFSGSCVGIYAVTEEQKILLVEQFRIPLDANSIELPAGLVGDEEEFKTESIEQCANRELIEETGYSAGKMNLLLTTPSSAGLSNEIVHLFQATELTKVSAGGGVDSEDITVHEIELSKLSQWTAEQVALGKVVDAKIFSCIQLASYPLPLT